MKEKTEKETGEKQKKQKYGSITYQEKKKKKKTLKEA